MCMAFLQIRTGLLGVYLNDHLAGATMGAELAGRLARADRQWAAGSVLDQLAEQIAADRQALLEIMAELGVPVRQYKVWASWLAEKVGRAKLNNRFITRSPLSRLIELEMLRLGVEGKAVGWRTLRAVAGTDSRIDTTRLDRLIDRADEQIDELKRLHLRAADEAFSSELRH
jgi:hypothetical protein